MPCSGDPALDDQQLARYVLGLLPDEEAERLDEASIADDEMAARLRNVENDLVDAYVSSTMDRDTRMRFEAVYLGSARRRERVAFARRFLAAVDRAPRPPSVPAAPAPPRPSEPQPVRSTVNAGVARRSRFVRPLQAAAALLLVACGVLLFANFRLLNRLDEARRHLTEQQRRAQTLASGLNDARAANAAAADALERARATLAVVLLPQTRAIGPVATIAVSRGVDRIALELRVETQEFARYQASLKNPRTNRVLWHSTALRAASVPGAFSVSIVIPAADLPPQHYALELIGVGAADRREIVATYVFQLEGR